MVKKTGKITRKELKERLTSAYYKSSIDAILDPFGRFLKRVFRTKKQVSYWLSAFTLAFLVMLTVYLAALLTGGLSKNGYRTIIFGGGLIFINLVIAKNVFDRIYKTLKEKLVPGSKSVEGLSGLQGWLKATSLLLYPVLTSIVVYVVNTAFVLYDPVEGIAPVETIGMGGIMLLWTGFMLYYMVLFILLPLKLKGCRLVLHEEDPASTQLLVEWDDMMNFIAYMFAIMLALGTLFTITVTPFRLRTLIFIIPRWVMLIVTFAVNQIVLSKMISSTKRVTLKKIEDKMKVVKSKGTQFEEKTISSLMTLWDYHSRIKNTRNSMFNLKGLVNFINTLLIPLLAFILANFDAIRGIVGL